MTRKDLTRLGKIKPGASITVRKEPGPGLPEPAYQLPLAREPVLRKIYFRTQVPVDLTYGGTSTSKVYVMDLLVEEEIKSAATTNPIFGSELITHLRLAGKDWDILLILT